MADTAVTERRIRPILDAMKAGNWRQALKDCEKWQKKGESSDRFMALKAAVLMRQSDEKQQEKGANETLQLCRRTPPVLNFEAIHQLQDSLRLMSLETEEGPKLWERAVAAKPSDEDLITTWLENSISLSSWQNAQKATMALRKAFPKDRRYDFWNVLMCYLIYQDTSLPEKDRKLFGTLASRMITKAAQPGSPDKMISNTEELSLLATVLMKTDNVTELTHLLQSDSLKPVIGQDQPTADTLLLQAINADAEATAIDKVIARLEVTNDETENRDDDRIWSLFVKSAKTAETVQARIQQVDRILEKHPQHRQAYLAKIDLLASPGLDANDPEPLQSVCLQYYHLFGSKAYCFDDLISRLRAARLESVYEFEKRLKSESSDSPTAIQALFMLKLEFNLLFEGDVSVLKVLSFVSDALQLFTNARDNPSVGPESGLLAALALLRLAARSKTVAFMAQASMILQTVCTKFKDYYPLRVLQLQLQAASGQISLAMNNFFQLSIKNLQWETIGHLILTRISTLHPQQHGQGEDAFSPLGAFDTALTVFQNWQRSLDRAIREGLKNESYSNIIDTVELRSNLQSSIVRRIYTIEQRKCQRALGLPVVPRFDPHEAELTDLRDVSFMPRYGVEDHSLSELLQCGTQPSRGWVNAMTMHECLMTYLMAELAAPHAGIIDIAIENLAKSEVQIAPEAADLTEDEKEAIQIYQDLVAIVMQVVKKVSSNARNLGNAIARIRDAERGVQPARLNDVEYPDWKYLHHRHVKLETLQTLAHFTAIMLKKFKAEKDKSKSAMTAELKKSLEEVRPLINEQVNAIHEQAKELKQQLNAPGVLGKLVDTVLGRTEDVSAEHDVFAQRMAELQDEAAAEEYCGSLKESWEDALDGILVVKIKTV